MTTHRRIAAALGFAPFATALFTCLTPTAAFAGDDCPQERPTDPGGYLGYVYDAAATSFDTPEGNGRIWYAPSGKHAPPLTSTRADGVPDSVANVGVVLENALAQYAKMGYQTPLRDGDFPACASNGGDGRIDVYLISFTGSDGLTVGERCKAGPGKTTVCPGFLLVDHTFAGRGYKNFLEGAKTVVPHELFHLVQNSYDSTIDRFWAEGTAEWADKQVYPELLDLERFLPDFFSQVERPLDAPAGGAVAGYLYGSAIFPVFLGETHGPQVIQKIFANIGTGAGPVLDHVDQVLAGEKTTLADDFALFATWNAATGTRAGSAGGYASAAIYPMIPAPVEFPMGLPTQVSGTTAGYSTRYVMLRDPSPRMIQLTADDTRLGGVALPLQDGKARVDLAAKLPTVVTGETLVLLAGRSSKKTDVAYTLAAVTVPPPDADGGVDAGPLADTGGGGGGGSSGGCALDERARSSENRGLFAIGLTLVCAFVARRRRTSTA